MNAQEKVTKRKSEQNSGSTAEESSHFISW